MPAACSAPRHRTPLALNELSRGGVAAGGRRAGSTLDDLYDRLADLGSRLRPRVPGACVRRGGCGDELFAELALDEEQAAPARALR